MQSFPQTIILRHRRENLKKCSLRGLEGREGFAFYSYPDPLLPPLTGYVLLTLGAPPLSLEDKNSGLIIVDATWRLAEKMVRYLDGLGPVEKRSLPPIYRTAYPRRQEDCTDPNRGLASIEAIYTAYQTLQRDTRGILDHYYWKDQFFKINGIE